jgi:hypothetical protein
MIRYPEEYNCDSCRYGIRSAPEVYYFGCTRPSYLKDSSAEDPCPYWEAKEDSPPGWQESPFQRKKEYRDLTNPSGSAKLSNQSKR